MNKPIELKNWAGKEHEVSGGIINEMMVEVFTFSIGTYVKPGFANKLLIITFLCLFVNQESPIAISLSAGRRMLLSRLDIRQHVFIHGLGGDDDWLRSYCAQDADGKDFVHFLHNIFRSSVCDSDPANLRADCQPLNFIFRFFVFQVKWQSDAQSSESIRHRAKLVY